MGATAADQRGAGRELDALVAEKIFGARFWLETRGEYTLAVFSMTDEPWKRSQQWVWEREKKRYEITSAAAAARTGFFGTGPASYSADISAAWQVVEKLAPSFRRFEVIAVDGEYVAQIEQGSSEVDEYYIASVVAPTAPLAICLAALEATGGPR